ncbi:MAG: DUF433 domain-containing protein [Tepidisphaeraceae bacterium]|jgi:uncharacterized protein (DUF433 family)
MNIVTRDPEILGGLPCFRGTRVPLQNLFDYLEHNRSIDEFIEDFPTVAREHVVAALEWTRPQLIATAGI